MSGQNKVSGVVLAGGMGRRVEHKDKGLLMFKHQPLVTYALAALAPLTDELFISANRNQAEYRQFGYPVLTDAGNQFDGPLAGILAAMQAAKYPVLLISPCDSPNICSELLQRLLNGLDDAHHDIVVASDGNRLHPVFAAIKTCLIANLQQYLHSGERKLLTWLERHSLKAIDCSDFPEVFINIKTLQQLQELEKSTG